jgi:hypothetical protein
MGKNRLPGESPSLSDRFLLRISLARQVDGLWIGANGETELNRAKDALALIKLHDPRRLWHCGIGYDEEGRAIVSRPCAYDASWRSRQGCPTASKCASAPPAFRSILSRLGPTWHSTGA